LTTKPMSCILLNISLPTEVRFHEGKEQEPKTA
jgi:hypothetical protein